MRLVKADPQARATGPLTELAALSFGPLTVVAEEFADVAGVEAVYLFGSWAARYDGESGPPPYDVDVLVVGRPSHRDVFAAAAAAEARLGGEVNPTVRTPEGFAAQDDPFIAQLKSRPLIRVWPTDEGRQP